MHLCLVHLQKDMQHRARKILSLLGIQNGEQAGIQIHTYMHTYRIKRRAAPSSEDIELAWNSDREQAGRHTYMHAYIK